MITRKDDHDYGKNDGDSEFALKKESQKEFLQFIDEPPESIRWKREGIYFSISLGPKGKRTKLIFLDHRYFRDPQHKALEGGDTLGQVQWRWLTNVLKDSDAQLNLIFTGIQLLPNDKPIREKWANYPSSYRQFFQVLEETRPKGVVLFSGDIHYAEILRTNCSRLGYPLYEFTSSGLTHSCQDELSSLCSLFLSTIWNSHMRVGEAYAGRNFGTVEIHWDKTPVEVSLQIRNVNGTLMQEVKISFACLTDR